MIRFTEACHDLLQIRFKTLHYCHPDCSAHVENERLLLQPLGETTYNQLLQKTKFEKIH